jgi:hypothetical protein
MMSLPHAPAATNALWWPCPAGHAGVGLGVGAGVGAPHALQMHGFPLLQAVVVLLRLNSGPGSPDINPKVQPLGSPPMYIELTLLPSWKLAAAAPQSSTVSMTFLPHVPLVSHV